MKSKLFAYIEKNLENDCYVAIVPGLPGAHTQADSLEELRIRLKEVVELCLEEMNPEERQFIHIGGIDKCKLIMQRSW